MSSEEQEIIQEAFQYYDQKGDSKIAAGQVIVIVICKLRILLFNYFVLIKVSTCLRSLGCVPSEKQLTSFTKQWESKGKELYYNCNNTINNFEVFTTTIYKCLLLCKLFLDTRVSIEEFIPIYGDLKKTSQPADEHALLSSCLSNFDRDQEGYIQQADLRHMLENFGKSLYNCKQ